MRRVTQLRMVDTPLGQLTYGLSVKRVKNWNLRVKERQVLLSVPLRVGAAQADAFIRARAAWIFRALERQSRACPVPAEPLTRQECARRLSAAVERMYPLVSGLGVARPTLCLRKMKSQWGNCHYRQGYITLNTALAACPEELQDYVALHELVHFLHPDHGPGFYAAMNALMPDWKVRRGRLKEYALP